MGIHTYAGDFVTVKYWDYEEDPVYAESTDTGNGTGWGLNHNWRALVDAIDALHDGVEFTAQAVNPLGDAGLWLEIGTDLLVLQDILGIALTNNLVINEDGDDYDIRIEGDTDANLFFVDAGNDRVGIGTNAPSVKFEVNGASKLGGALTVVGQGGFDGGVVINEGGYDNDSRIEGDTEPNLFFVDAGEERIGVGINAPFGRLHVRNGNSGMASYTGVNSFIVEHLGNGGMALIANNAASSEIGFYDPDDPANYRGALSYSHSLDALLFYSAGNIGMRIDNSQKVKIGSGTPQGKLDIELSTENFVIVDAGSAGATEQDWVEVKVGAFTGYIRVYASK